MPKPQKSRLTKRADDWRNNIKRTRPPREGASSAQHPAPDVLGKFKPRDTSKPANPRPINMGSIPKPGPFRPDAKLDRSQVTDKRGTRLPNRRKSTGSRRF